MRDSLLRNDPSCPVEPSLPVPGAHILDADRRAWPGRVDETILSKVNTDVGEGPFGVVENQIACLEAARVDWPAEPALRARVVGQPNAIGFLEDVRNQAAAVEPAGRRLSAPVVGHTGDGEGLHDCFGCLSRSCLLARGCTRTPRKNQRTKKQLVTKHD